MKTFGELTREEKIELFTAWIDGKEIQVKHANDEWKDVWKPTWESLACYRIKPTKPSINWDHVNPDYNWIAMDWDGITCLYSKKPDLSGDHWWGNPWREADSFTSFKPGTCNWKDSLVERPKK